MTNELATRNSAEIAHSHPATQFSTDQLQLLKDTICQGATDNEFALFVNQCKRTGLDPFARQIHAVKRWDQKAGREVMAIQVGIDGFRLIAERTGCYAPGREPEFEYDNNGAVISATAYVQKWVRGGWHETAAKAFFDEYVQTTRDGKPIGMWGKMPRNQIAKCAEALALRRAFPQDLSGLYTSDEMAQADNDDPRSHQAIPVQQPTPTVDYSHERKLLADACSAIIASLSPTDKTSAQKYIKDTFGKAFSKLAFEDFEKLREYLQHEFVERVPAEPPTFGDTVRAAANVPPAGIPSDGPEGDGYVSEKAKPDDDPFAD